MTLRSRRFSIVGLEQADAKLGQPPRPLSIVCIYDNPLPTTMPHETAAENPFLSMRPSDSNLTVSLHPLVLLTVSDHITRHRVRGEAGPVVGALLGQQKGRETTIEHAFSCRAIPRPNGEVILDESWFGERLQQCMWYSEYPINIGCLLTMK